MPLENDKSPVERRLVLKVAPALMMVNQVLEHAASHGWSVAVVVVDTSGEVIASARMDGVSAQIMGFAADKAFTAATMRRSTRDFAARMNSSDPLRMGLANRSRLLVWEGGLPILHEGVAVGGIGVSGAEGHEDAECAVVALGAAGLSGGA